MASRGGAVTRRASSSRAGPLAGWAWRDARSAVQFGKRQGAWAVELRPACARFLFDAACGKQDGLFQHARRVARPGGQQRRGEGQARKPSSPASSMARPPTDSPSASGTDAALPEPVRVVASKRKQRSAARSAEFHRRLRVRDRMRRLLQLFVSRYRYERRWSVHNAWYPTWATARSATADAAVPPALGIERMDEDSGHAAGPAEHRTTQLRPGLSPAASEFVPGTPTAVVERAACAAADEVESGNARRAHAAARAAKAAAAERARAATVKALSKERVKRGAAMLIANADPPPAHTRRAVPLGTSRSSG